MNTLQARSPAVRPGVKPEELHELIERIGATRHFRRAGRLRAFLEYVCEQALNGNAEQINEHSIGRLVFGRPASYEPSDDSIVRVEARELRKRLEAYFEEEGAAEPLVIRIPKGGYVPAFEYRTTEAPVEANPEAAPERLVEGGPGPEAGWGSTRLAVGVLSALVVALSTACVLLYFQASRAAGAGAAASAAERLPERVAAFWSQMFDSERGLLVSLADSNLAFLQDLRGESITLAEYTTGRYLAKLQEHAGEGEAARLHGLLASKHFTSLADANAVARIMLLNRHFAPVRVRFARDLNVRDFKTQNLLILGSARSNPWVELLAKDSRFRIEYDPRSNLALVRDLRPEPGNPPAYFGGPQGEKPYEAYGLVTSTQNVDRSSHALLIGGTNMQGTEAAADFIANPATLDEFLSRIGWRGRGPLPSFEVVLKLVTVGGSPISSQILATHVPSAANAASSQGKQIAP